MFLESVWNDWVKEELKNYEIDKSGKRIYIKKGYLHLDNRIWFPEQLDEIKRTISSELLEVNSTSGKLEYHSFYPFIKILVKTPRYRYQFEEGHYDLETKIRPICFAAHKDSLIMSYYSFYLTKVYEDYIKKEKFDDVVLAYRSDLGKCNIQFAKEAFDIVKSRKECTAIALDISGYFDHIDHKILLNQWQKVLKKKLPEDQYRLYKVLTKYSYINQASFLKKYKGLKKRGERMCASLMDYLPGNGINKKFKRLKEDNLVVTNDKMNVQTNRHCGIPQGSPISALLSNIYMLAFDNQMKVKSDREGFVYRRYCDDLLIICDTAKAVELLDFITKKISSEYFLTINKKKAEVIDFKKNSKGNIRGFRRPFSSKIKNNQKVVALKAASTNTTSANEGKFYKPLQYLGFEYNGKNVTIRSSSLSRFFRKLNYRLGRTVIMAHSPKAKSDQIFMRQIYERYTHIGFRNFLTYAYKAAKNYYEDSNGIKKEGLNSVNIKKQLRNHFSLLRHELQKKNEKWFAHKLMGKKEVTLKFFK
jgi:RNA-directed DNA polymerase